MSVLMRIVLVFAAFFSFFLPVRLIFRFAAIYHIFAQDTYKKSTLISGINSIYIKHYLKQAFVSPSLVFWWRLCLHSTIFTPHTCKQKKKLDIFFIYQWTVWYRFKLLKRKKSKNIHFFLFRTLNFFHTCSIKCKRSKAHIEFNAKSKIIKNSSTSRTTEINREWEKLEAKNLWQITSCFLKHL